MAYEIAQDGPDYFIDEFTKGEIRKDTGDFKPGVAYVRDSETSKWREIEPRDYDSK